MAGAGATHLLGWAALPESSDCSSSPSASSSSPPPSYHFRPVRLRHEPTRSPTTRSDRGSNASALGGRTLDLVVRPPVAAHNPAGNRRRWPPDAAALVTHHISATAAGAYFIIRPYGPLALRTRPTGPVTVTVTEQLVSQTPISHCCAGFHNAACSVNLYVCCMPLTIFLAHWQKDMHPPHRRR